MRLLPILLFAVASMTPPLVAAPKPEVRPPDTLLTYRTIGELELKLEVFRPAEWKASDRRPAVIFFFGGGWVGGATSQFHPQAAHLAKLGLVAFCADYRVKKRHQTTPFDAVEDAKAAVRWLWRHAAEQGVDPKKIITSGGSAGGHLAACCGVVPGFDEIREGEPVFLPAAMVLYNPVIDTSQAGFGYKALQKRYKELSPLEHVHDRTPPTLLMVGSADTTTPPGGDKAFAAKMKERSLQCQLEIYEGQKHGFFNPRGNNEHYWMTLKAVDEFLDRLGYVK